MRRDARAVGGRSLAALWMTLIPSMPAPAAPATAEVDAAPCEACHGARGEGMAAAHIPRLAGQSAEYLRKQLDDYARGARDNAVMSNFAKALSERQRIEFAARYAAMSAPYLPQSAPLGPKGMARGHQLAYQGDESKRAPACNGCHGPDGIGVAHAAPYLAGQSAQYLAAALKAFRRGTRKNDAGELMRSVVQHLDDADVAAVSGYFASIDSSTH